MEYPVGQRRKGCFSRMCGWIRCVPKRLSSKMVEFVRKAKKLGEEDPRRVVHSLKVGLAITLVSQIYYLDTLYEGFGDAAMWAVLTVVVVLEFSVGATLGRGLNRGLATFLAGTLGFGAHHVASLFGEKLQPILLGLFVFLLAVSVTFIRFFPHMKARYDYGLLVFILTFCLISVSGYRDEEVLDMALNRISTILIGGFFALFVCIFLYPVWAGEDLHNLIAANIEKLGLFLEDFGDEFFQSSREGESNKASLEGYKSVLNSKNTEETLANFARWEPGHGQFRYRHPWKQYLEIGSLTRQCAYRIEALNGYLSSEIQVGPEIKSKIEEACTKMSSESGKALTEIAFAIKSMSPPFSASIHIVRSKQAATTLESLLNSSLFKDMNILEVVPVASVASLLTDVVSCTEELAESVHRLASLARFKCLEPKTAEQKKPEFCDDQGPLQKCATIGSHIIIDHRSVKPTTRSFTFPANEAPG